MANFTFKRNDEAAARPVSTGKGYIDYGLFIGCIEWMYHCTNRNGHKGMRFKFTAFSGGSQYIDILFQSADGEKYELGEALISQILGVLGLDGIEDKKMKVIDQVWNDAGGKSGNGGMDEVEKVVNAFPAMKNQKIGLCFRPVQDNSADSQGKYTVRKRDSNGNLKFKPALVMACCAETKKTFAEIVSDSDAKEVTKWLDNIWFPDDHPEYKGKKPTAKAQPQAGGGAPTLKANDWDDFDIPF